MLTLVNFLYYVDHSVHEIEDGVKDLHVKEESGGVATQEPEGVVTEEHRPEGDVAADSEDGGGGGVASGAEGEEQQAGEVLVEEEARMLDPEQGSFYLTQVFVDMFNL